MRENYRINITLAFIFFAIFIIISTVSIVMFYWTKISTQNFKNKVLISSRLIHKEFLNKQLQAKSNLDGIVKVIFLKEMNPNEEFLYTIFKAFLLANQDFIKISIQTPPSELFCKKIQTNVFCNKQRVVNQTSFFLLHYTEMIDQNRTLAIDVNLYPFFKSINSDTFKLMVLDKNGQILYTNFFKAKSIFDIFEHSLASKILHQNSKFITNDIYTDTLGKYKLVYIQNKQILNRQKLIAKKLVISMFVLSVIFAVIFGYIFSKPLYHFYDELDKQVKSEIDKNREKEQMLMHQNKLASLGEMLGNIAHQWRHPLTRLSLLVQNLQMAYDTGHLNQEFVNKFKTKALEQINYMSSTIDDFTNFFKKDKQTQTFDVPLVIDNTLELLESRLKNITVYKDYHPLTIDGYKTEFSQVILNILNNAID
ncbi:MAG: HAMP domain-containing histidine kinase, partial [Epsilonproteobacteria bacterium]|nr:HAMP domain-containing histidine kinase [Campylobacterota bacterium]